MLQQMIQDAAYMAHGYCLLWQPWLVGLHVFSDLIIAWSYFAIPVAIWIFMRRRPNLEMRGLAALFAAFILACGITHVFGMTTIWLPVYELQGVAKAVTAVVSVVTAIAIFPLIPRALAIPSPTELQNTNLALTAEIAAHRRTLDDLRDARAQLERRYERQAQELEESERRFRASQETSPDGFMMFDAVRDGDGAIADLRWVYSNQAAERMIGRTDADLKGRQLLIEMPRSEGGLFDAYARVIETGAPLQEEVLYDQPWLTGWYRVTAVKVGDGIAVSFSDISARKAQEDQLRLLMREVNHRAKNILAIVSAIVRISARFSRPEDFIPAVQARLAALSESHDLLVENNWSAPDVASLVTSQLHHLGEDMHGQISVDGPPVRISSDAAQGIGLALHELTTNAIKYGALSTDAGRVAVAWRVEGERFELTWRETGGPPVTAPDHTGFGRTVIERMSVANVGGETKLDFKPEGVEWTLTAPASAILK